MHEVAKGGIVGGGGGEEGDIGGKRQGNAVGWL